MAAEDYFDVYDLNDQAYHDQNDGSTQSNKRNEFPLTIKKSNKKKIKENTKPTLIRVGSHLIDPTDVTCITKIKGKDLFVVRLKSQPNMEYPIWVNKNEIGIILEYFNIVTVDE